MGGTRERIIDEVSNDGDRFVITTQKVIIKRAGDPDGDRREISLPGGLRGSNWRQLVTSCKTVAEQGRAGRNDGRYVFAVSLLRATGLYEENNPNSVDRAT